MILYHSPGSCSEGLKLMLQLAGLPFEVRTVLISKQEHRAAEFLALNPKGKIPALGLPSGEVITEYPVIASYLADQVLENRLLPQAPAARREALSWIEYIVSTLHMRGAALVFKPDRFTSSEAAQQEIAAHGREVVRGGYDMLAERLGDRLWFFEGPGALEATTFYVTSWADRLDIRLPENLDRLRERLLEAASNRAS